MGDFGCMVVAPLEPDCSPVAAAATAAGVGVLDVTGLADPDRARHACAALARLGPGKRVGLRLDPLDDRQVALLGSFPPTDSVAVLAPTEPADLLDAVARCRPLCSTLYVEVVDVDVAVAAEALDVDALVANGNEAGGEVSQQTSLVLLQRLLDTTTLPVWVRGGVGAHSAAGCLVAGAAGVVLDCQLGLVAESALGPGIRDVIACSDGANTICVGDRIGAPVRVLARPGLGPVAELQRLADELAESPDEDAARRLWRQAVRGRLGWSDLQRHAVPLGQDAGLAATLATRYATTDALVRGLVEDTGSHVRSAARQRALRRGGPLAEEHGTTFPIVQGPMTRVSDEPEFVAATARAGALPFLALALADADRSVELIARTSELLGDRPWGVGVLGFVPSDVRAAQIEAIRGHPPRFALVAGGRPDQARTLEQAGITTYLHVPSPGLLSLFLAEGSRSFVFEGRECGGHVGPRSSLVLWDQMVTTILTELDVAETARCRLLFAGGVHDGVTAAAVAAVAAPLVSRGARIGVLVGTGYMFTDEAVATGAITPTFQEIAVGCTRTVLLETGPGHASRCAMTAYAGTFAGARDRQRREGQSPDEAKDELERLNLGRLRVATRGVAHAEVPGASGAVLSRDDQRRDGMFMIGDTATLRTRRLGMAELHRDISHGSARRLDLLAGPPAQGTSRGGPIAIVGMACLLPGAADLAGYWRNILTSRDAVREVPEDRWRTADYFDPDPAAPDKIYSRWGGFLEDVTIDPLHFGIPPAALPSIEPMQLLALHTAEAALADAGCLDSGHDHSRTSVIFGVGGGIADLGQRYAVRSGVPMLLNGSAESAYARLPEWTEDSFAGILLNVVAGRVANRFDLGGVNLAVDAACASSLAAVQLAQRELDAGTSDLVVVGGADTVQNPFGYLCFSKTRALSPRGRCHSFDASADGIAISEGVAVVVLKRLADAQREGDRIYATVAGVGSSSDGRGAGLTAPRADGQERALRRAFDDAHCSPASVELVEAHGTGTAAGDRTEVAALTRVFASAAPEGVALGSVKSMIGHTKCTAGLAGLIKTALALHHRVLPATLNVTAPAPGLADPDSRFYVNSATRPWVHTTPEPRRAGVSSFGFGGVNVHAVLEEHVRPGAEAGSLAPAWPADLYLLAGDSWQELGTKLAHLDAAASSGDEDRLHTLAADQRREATALARSGSAPVRCGVVAADLAEVRSQVTALREAIARGHEGLWKHPRGTVADRVGDTGCRQTAFLFPGQGSQYPDMLRELAVLVPSVRESIEDAERALHGRLEAPLSTYLFPPPRFTDEARRRDGERLTATEVAQPALGAVSSAMATLLGDCGVRPDLVAGHSYGEYAALSCAGVLDRHTMIRLSHARGRCIRDAATPGSMVAVTASAEDVSAVLRDLPDWTTANLNAPHQTVVAGPTGSVPAVLEALADAGLSASLLPVACAFHSRLVAPAADALVEVLAEVPFEPAAIPVFSNTTATSHPAAASDVRDLLGRHLVEPVRFEEEVRAMYDDGAGVFVEVGPRAVLTGLVGQVLHDRPHVAVASDAPSGGARQFLACLARLFVAGAPVDTDHLGLREPLPGGPPDPPRRTAWLVNGGRAVPLPSGLSGSSSPSREQVVKQS